RAGLGDLVLMMWKLQIHAAAMQIEVLAQELYRHRRALDVPPRPPPAPRRVPRGLAGLGLLPEHEIQWIALALVDLDTCAGAQVIEPLARQAAVRGKLLHRVEHISGRPDIGE